MVCRIERNATPRRLASEMGSQANSASAVPPLPASMLRFSGQSARQPEPAAEQQQPSAAQRLPAAPAAAGAAAAGAGLAAGSAAGRAAAEATADSARV